MAIEGLTKLDFVSHGFRDVLMSTGVKEWLTETGEAIASEAGEGFNVKTIRGGYGGGRWVAFVQAETDEARYAEATEKSLTRAGMRLR